jgi:hypothetical protein
MGALHPGFQRRVVVDVAFRLVLAQSGWHLRGSYFESCNCDAICPCRRIGGVAGGRSTHGVCLGALSWLVEAGRFGDTDLDGLGVVLAFR